MKLYGFAAGPYQTNTFIVANGTRAFVVDPGLHASQKVVEMAQEHGLELEAVVLTHGHLDHTREAGELALEFKIPVYIHPADAPMLTDLERISEEAKILFGVGTMVKVDDVRDLDGESINLCGADFALKHAPGHTPGSTIIVGSEFALTGDVLFKGTIGRTDLPGSNPADMQATLRGPVWELDDSLTILPGHGSTTTMKAERASNPFLVSLGEVM